MKKQKTYIRLTLVISILFGIILPLAVGVKDILVVSLIFSSIWFVYVIVLWIRVFFSSEALEGEEIYSEEIDTIEERRFIKKEFLEMVRAIDRETEREKKGKTVESHFLPEIIF